MIVSLLPYLWKNAQPSTMLMGDAGSRALGLFLCITMFKTGNALLIIPMCCMLCLDDDNFRRKCGETSES